MDAGPLLPFSPTRRAPTAPFESFLSLSPRPADGMHGHRAVLLVLVVGLVPLTGCIGVDNMGELRSTVTGEGLDTHEPVAEPPENRAPRAVVDAERTEVRAGQAVAFDGTGSLDPDGAVVAWEWTVDGLAVGASPRLVHAFEAAGVHRVELTVLDDEEASDSAHVDVSVSEDEPPVAELSIVEVAEGDDGEAAEVHRTRVDRALSFSAADSHDPEDAELSYRWDLGDGNVSTDATVRHAYAEGGRYEVRLVVEDPGGQTAEATRVLAVDAAGSAEGTVTVEAPEADHAVPVATGAGGAASELVATLTYTTDAPLSDLDLVLVAPDGTEHPADDGEGLLPGDKRVSVTVPEPADGAWTARVTLDVGVEIDYVVDWTVRY